MNAWLLRAAWWKLSIVVGLLLAPFFVLLFRLIGDRSWTAAVVLAVGVTVICAPGLGYLTANEVRDSMAAAEEVPEHERALVERAARRGPVPDDEGQREAALHLVEDRLLALRATRTRALTFSAVLVLVTGFFAVAQSAWWWIAVAATLALVALVLTTPVRLERRVELLRRDGG
ncbi:hypothetical protein SAMN05216574_102297 [Blastococcus tunisiensis]|uniref:Uncharacterized protein n=2 Tax=Blastococcus tunisiensis TaxID=1798228 RepID=A0A1I1Y9F2_9ACTN|nr:hypothetical protein SAMN05216574_102297 [Blastococcus sp. DSM 46838]